jgi:mRNA-degrading endonuclease toxin of MazEF toxin-antitoxin module
MYKQGDIVLVRYPFSDDPAQTKVRPAVVISNENSNRLDSDVLIAQITSAIRLTPFSFPLTHVDVTVPLPKPSEVRCNKVATARNNIILQKISAIKPEKLPSLIATVYDAIRVV